MMFTNLRQWWKQSTRSVKTRSQARRQRRGYRLLLESLEDRTLLSVTFTPGPYTVPANNTDIPPHASANITFSPIEPQISVNPANPGQIFFTDQYQSTASTNAGGSFQPLRNFPLARFGGDTSTVYDAQGNLYWVNIDANNNLPPTIVQVNPVTGTFIGIPHAIDAPPVVGGVQTGDDKPFLATDGTNLYVAFGRSSTVGGGIWSIMLSRSINQGVSWSTPVQVSVAGEGYVWPSSVAVASDGSVFVAYHSEPAGTTTGQIVVARYNNNLSLQISKTTPFPQGSAVRRGSYPGMPFPGGAGSAGVAGPWVLTDPIRPGNVYVFSINDPSSGGAGDPADIVFARTTINGQNWTTSTLVSGPGTSVQVLPTAAIDNFGNIVVAWYDSRNGGTNPAGTNSLLDVYAKYSTDGGQSWSSDFQVNDSGNRFDPQNSRMPDYIGIAVFGGTAYVAWGGNTWSSTNPDGTPAAGATVTGQQPWLGSFAISGSIVVTENSSFADTITIAGVPNNPKFVQVSVNGTVEYAGLASALTSITVDDRRFGGSDIVNIEKDFGIPITVNLGGGNSIVNISPTAKNFNATIQGLVTVNGGSGINTLNVNDQNDNVVGLTWTLDASSISNSNFFSALVRYNAMEFVTLQGGSGNVTRFNVENTLAATTISAGAASNVVVVSPVALNLDNIVGALTVNGNGTVQLIVNDQNSPNTLVTQDFLSSNRLWRLGRKFDPVTLQLVTHEALIYYGGLGSLVLNTGFLPNVVYVEGTSTPTTVNCGPGTQVVDVGVDVILGSLNLDKLVGALTVNGNGTVQLIVNDQLATAAETYSVTANLVSRTGAAPISYGNLASLAIYGGSGNDTVNVLSTVVGTTTLIDSGRGADVFQIGDNRRLAGINGPLHLQSATSFSGTDLFLDDSNETDPKTQVVLNDGSVTGLAPATISWTSSATGAGGITGVYVNGGRGGNKFTVENTSLLYHYTFLIPGSGVNQVNVRGEQGVLLIHSVFGEVETVTIGSQAPALGGTLANVNGDIYLQGGGTASLVVDDSGTTADRTATVTATDVKWQSPATIHWLPGEVNSVTLNWGSGNDLIYVESTAADVTTVINGGDGNDTFVSSSLDALRGPLSLHGQGGPINYPLLYDYKNPVGQTYTLTADQVRRAGKADITFDGMIQLILYTSLTGADIVNVEGVAPGVFTPIVLGIGDKITLGRPVATGGRTLQDIHGIVRPQTYGRGAVTVIVDDSADTDPRDASFAFDTPNPNYFNIILSGMAPAPIYFILDAACSLTVRGGKGNDTFRLPTALSPAPLTLIGGAGVNTLDYSASTAGVTVNLLTGKATGAKGGIAGFTNVFGGSGDDELTGNAAANTLRGYDGNDRLFGGDGIDFLDGGNGNDYLDGGRNLDFLSGGQGNDTFKLDIEVRLRVLESALSDFVVKDDLKIF